MPLFHVYHPRMGGKPHPDQCCASISERGRGVFSHQCNNRPVVKEKVEGKLRWCCAQHSSKGRAKREERFRRKYKANEDRWARKERQDRAARECIRVLRAIANDAARAQHEAKKAINQLDKANQ